MTCGFFLPKKEKRKRKLKSDGGEEVGGSGEKKAKRKRKLK